MWNTVLTLSGHAGSNMPIRVIGGAKWVATPNSTPSRHTYLEVLSKAVAPSRRLTVPLCTQNMHPATVSAGIVRPIAARLYPFLTLPHGAVGKDNGRIDQAVLAPWLGAAVVVAAVVW